MIDRRKLMIGAIAASQLSLPARAKARPLLAALFVQTRTGPTAEIQNIPFRAALAKLGWMHGENIDIVERFADGRLDRLAPLAAELVALRPDVIFTHTGNAAHAVAKATQSIPVVVGPATEESLTELAGDLARPRANVTGLTFVSQEMHEKCVELLAQIHPGARRVAVLVDPRITAYQTYPATMQANLGKLGLTLHRIEAPGGRSGIDAAMRSLAAAIEATALPSIVEERFFVEMGGLVSYSTNLADLFHRSASYVAKILKGARPSDLPIQLPTKFEFVVNLKTAQKLGLAIPPAILLRADEVIE
jgi:putative tryptophan/tyrosine transport system substrate-binding protein